MLKRRIATVKSRFSHIAETETPAHALMINKADREETAFLNKILLGISRQPQGLRTYTSTVEFQRQMAVDVAPLLEEVRTQKDQHHPRWQNEEAFRIREAYKIEKWKELSPSDQEKWIDESKKAANKDIESMTPLVHIKHDLPNLSNSFSLVTM